MGEFRDFAKTEATKREAAAAEAQAKTVIDAEEREERIEALAGPLRSIVDPVLLEAEQDLSERHHSCHSDQ